MEKIKESEEKGHTTRLLQRANRLSKIKLDLKETKMKAENINEQLEKTGEPQKRADRDFRKQLIMTVRTLILENCLMRFWKTLTEGSGTKIGMDNLIDVLFNRRVHMLKPHPKLTTGLIQKDYQLHTKKKLTSWQMHLMLWSSIGKAAHTTQNPSCPT